jgi:predicted kinase
MRQLYVLRGVPGCGKSTWIKQKGLEAYSISSDAIRLLFAAPVMGLDGQETISFKRDADVWKMLFARVEERMEQGELIIVDAAHSKIADIGSYRKIAEKHRYRTFVIDFTGVPYETCLEQNEKREVFRRVPLESMEKMKERMNNKEYQAWVKVITPDNFDKTVQYVPMDLSSWKKIHHIGDIHGCATALAAYVGDGLKDDELYIFLGDFFDRGIENAKVLEFMIAIKDNDNVILIEGNHERHLNKWANQTAANEGEPVQSKEFRLRTQVEFEIYFSGQVEEVKKQSRMLNNKLRQCVYYSYGEKEILVTHGGLATIPKNLMMTATEQIIKGVGDYETLIDELFFAQTKDNQYQIHGHRNIQRFPVQVNARTFNLEGQVELGGHLRAVTLSEAGFETFEVKNDMVSDRVKEKVEVHNVDFIQNLRNNDMVSERKITPHISSFNFKPKAFYDKIWNNQTIRARGLFINVTTTELVGRSFDKFWNYLEREDHTLEGLKTKLVFPVKTYRKENGFLGILGYDSMSDSLVVASKSTTLGDFAGYFHTLLYGYLTPDKENELKDLLKKENVSLVFEVVDPVNDPHIVEYASAHLVLLDTVYREREFRKKSDAETVQIASQFGFPVKQHTHLFETWETFVSWLLSVTDESCKEEIEGYVVEDANQFMFKVKLPLYSFWKHMRTLKDVIAAGKEDGREMTSVVAKNFSDFLKTKTREELKVRGIISLRNEFEKSVWI